MPSVGAQSDSFRAIGRMLDVRAARDIQIVSHEVFVTVTWMDGGGSQQMCYQEHDLEQLRTNARLMRQEPFGTAREYSYSDLLRMLGANLDRDGIECSSVTEVPYGFRVSGCNGGKYSTQLFLTDQLQAEIDDEQMRRRVPVGSPARAGIDPFHMVMVGLPIMTQDNQCIGKVSAINGRHFKVNAGYLRRDYWLSSEYVADVRPGAGLALRLDRRGLDPIKRYAHPSRI